MEEKDGGNLPPITLTGYEKVKTLGLPTFNLSADWSREYKDGKQWA